MSEYLVILHDAEPATTQGRDQLRQELVSKLGISEDSVSEMFESLPVILKENVSREHAEDFLRILESMGANVEILASTGGSSNSGETPILQMTELNDSLDFASKEIESSTETVEELESILNGMLELGETDSTTEPLKAAPTQDAAAKSEQQETDGFFVETEEEMALAELSLGEIAAEDKASSEKVDATADDFEDLNKILEEELGLPGTAAMDTNAGSNDNELESMFSEALQSVEKAEEETKQEVSFEMGDAPSTDAKEDEASTDAPAEDLSVDISGLSLDTGDAPAAASEEVASEPEEEPAQVVASEPPADTGLSFDLALDEANDDAPESALEAALSPGAALLADDDEEEDPFAGLALPGEEEIEENAFASKPAQESTPAKAAGEKPNKATQDADEEIANAFATASVPVQSPVQSTEVPVSTETNGTVPESETVSAQVISTKKKEPLGVLLKRREVQLQIVCSLVLSILFAIAVKPDLVFSKKEEGLVIGPQAMEQIIARQVKRQNAELKAAIKPVTPAIQRWADSHTTEDGSRVSIEILSDGNKILGFDFMYEGAQPKEITPEELVDGIDRPWVTRVSAKAISLAEVVERTTSKMKEPQKILIAESPARAKVSDLKGNSLFAGKVRVELVLEGADTMSGKWQVTTGATPENVSDEAFHVKRLGPNEFELAINGKAELTPLTLTSSKK